MSEVDIVVVGGGAAGLSLARRLTAPAGPGRAVPSIAVIEPPTGPLSSPPRTWCFWERGEGDLDAYVSASWGRVLVRGAHREVVSDGRGHRYKMIRSHDFLPAVTAELASHERVRLLTATVTGIVDSPDGAQVTGTDATGQPMCVRGRWVFDSRPPQGLPPARTTLLQHFRGWFVRTASDRFDPGVAELMDFRTPQPARGLSFAYVLPFTRRRALVEYTEFSPRVLSDDGYQAALEHYTRRVRPLGAFTVTGCEQGVIPMTDAHFPRRRGARVFTIGAAGGAVRPATGYAFATIQRQAAAIATARSAGAPPLPPRPHPRRHLAMDAALLRALATGRVDGGAFFTRLFDSNPLPRVLGFLNGTSSLVQDVALGLHCPLWPMTRSLLELPFLPRQAAEDQGQGQEAFPHAAQRKAHP
ncbi:lycopene cyclase family protein [Streptomyces zagrosensis]|uniref:Lycopene beta-cyclase n=1 Tax=Streptomyces zagrosensis TaxID=1042984 RepID=A0A7W9QGB6_9ACTN|nr:lycopene cyclase family protein [Streptomyces zagrosensis]MBB5939761.1 lycopene beta-cyclase [Streptomyces zagrosensis]